MLPYHYPHPPWVAPDPRYPYPSPSMHSRQSSKACCVRHEEVISTMQRKMEQLETHLKSVMNHLAAQGLEAPTPLGSSTPITQSETRSVRKRTSVSDKESSKCSTIVKRRKMIKELEEQVNGERAVNQKMEERIAEMRKQLTEMRSKRLAGEQKRILEKMDEDSEVDVDGSEADSDDEYQSDIDEDAKNVPKIEKKREGVPDAEEAKK